LLAIPKFCRVVAIRPPCLLKEKLYHSAIEVGSSNFIVEGIILHKDGVIINLNVFGKSEILWFNDMGQYER